MAKTITRCALLTALSLCLSLLEQLFPLPVPLPGVRLGFANIVTLCQLLLGEPIAAAAVLAARILLSALLFGSPVTLLYSAAGGLLAFCAMLALRRAYPRRVSVFGISIAGAAAHNIGQVCMAALLLGDTSIFAYLAALLLCAVGTGAVTAAAAFPLIRRFSGKSPS